MEELAPYVISIALAVPCGAVAAYSEKRFRAKNDAPSAWNMSFIVFFVSVSIAVFLKKAIFSNVNINGELIIVMGKAHEITNFILATVALFVFVILRTKK